MVINKQQSTHYTYATYKLQAMVINKQQSTHYTYTTYN